MKSFAVSAVAFFVLFAGIVAENKYESLYLRTAVCFKKRVKRKTELYRRISRYLLSEGMKTVYTLDVRLLTNKKQLIIPEQMGMLYKE